MNDNNNATGRDTPASPGTGAEARSQAQGRVRQACDIQLSFDPDSGLVQAHLKRAEQAPIASAERVKALLRQAGYGDFHLPEAALESVVQSANNGQEGDFTLAERRDAQVKWRVSEDRQTVYLTLVPAQGGQVAGQAFLQEELTRLGVDPRCVKAEALAKALADGQVEKLAVACGVSPKAGRDTQFEPLIDISEDLPLREDEQGRVDMRQTHEFIVVEPGTPIMRRKAATQGRPGLDVLGHEIPAKVGRDLPYAKSCEGVEPDPQDPNVLRAAIRGHPVLIPQGVKVDPTLRLKQVNLNTGNVDFDGSVEVAGDVTSGFVVKATGDILVRGTVEKADIRAGKNLTIQGGVVGEDLGLDAQGKPILRTRLRAAGNLSAAFVSLAEVSAGRDLSLREYSMHAKLVAGRDLLVGQPSGKGCLIGGRAQAGRSVVANMIGSEASVATEVSVGRAPQKRRLLARLRQELALCEQNQDKLSAGLEAARAQNHKAPSSDKLTRVQQTLESLRKRRDRLKSLIERLVKRYSSKETAFVEVKRQLYANVGITIEGTRHSYQQDQGPRKLVRAGAELVSAPSYP